MPCSLAPADALGTPWGRQRDGRDGRGDKGLYKRKLLQALLVCSTTRHPADLMPILTLPLIWQTRTARRLACVRPSCERHARSQSGGVYNDGLVELYTREDRVKIAKLAPLTQKTHKV